MSASAVQCRWWNILVDVLSFQRVLREMYKTFSEDVCAVMKAYQDKNLSSWWQNVDSASCTYEAAVAAWHDLAMSTELRKPAVQLLGRVVLKLCNTISGQGAAERCHSLFPVVLLYVYAESSNRANKTFAIIRSDKRRRGMSSSAIEQEVLLKTYISSKPNPGVGQKRSLDCVTTEPEEPSDVEAGVGDGVQEVLDIVDEQQQALGAFMASYEEAIPASDHE